MLRPRHQGLRRMPPGTVHYFIAYAQDERPLCVIGPRRPSAHWDCRSGCPRRQTYKEDATTQRTLSRRELCFAAPVWTCLVVEDGEPREMDGEDVHDRREVIRRSIG